MSFEFVEPVESVLSLASIRPSAIDAVIQGGKEVLAGPFKKDEIIIPVRYLGTYRPFSAA